MKPTESYVYDFYQSITPDQRAEIKTMLNMEDNDNIFINNEKMRHDMFMMTPDEFVARYKFVTKEILDKNYQLWAKENIPF